MGVIRQMVLHFAEVNGGAGWGRVAKEPYTFSHKISKKKHKKVEKQSADDDKCYVLTNGCVITFDDEVKPRQGWWKKLVAKCICRGLSSRALIFHPTPIYGAGTPLVWGATPFFTPFYLLQPLSSHVEVRWGKRHPLFFAFPIRTKQKVSAHCIRSVWLIFTDKASALEIWYRQAISPVIFYVRIILDI